MGNNPPSPQCGSALFPNDDSGNPALFEICQALLVVVSIGHIQLCHPFSHGLGDQTDIVRVGLNMGVALWVDITLGTVSAECDVKPLHIAAGLDKPRAARQDIRVISFSQQHG